MTANRASPISAAEIAYYERRAHAARAALWGVLFRRLAGCIRRSAVQTTLAKTA